MTASARQRPKAVPHWPKPVADSSPRDHASTTVRLASGPVPLRGAEWGRRPQRPGNQSRLPAFSGFPPAIHPRESPAAAIVGQAQELPRFAEPTFSPSAAPRNTKMLRACAEAVEHETSLWKIEENSESICPAYVG
jgi:hypothetical protein